MSKHVPNPLYPHTDVSRLESKVAELERLLAEAENRIKHMSEAGAKTAVALVHAGIPSFGWNHEGVEKLAAKLAASDAYAEQLKDLVARARVWIAPCAAWGGDAEELYEEMSTALSKNTSTPNPAGVTPYRSDAESGKQTDEGVKGPAVLGVFNSAWVPVKERLPEKYQPVAVVNDHRFENVAGEWDRYLYACGYLDDAGSVAPYWSIRGERAQNIEAYTHWLALPAVHSQGNAPSWRGNHDPHCASQVGIDNPCNCGNVEGSQVKES